MEEVLLVRYGEIALKGQNRCEFERALMRHLRHVVRAEPEARVSRSHGRFYVRARATDDLLAPIARVPGVVAVSRALRVDKDLTDLIGAALHVARAASGAGTPPVTFKVESRRSDKTFPLTSGELNRTIGEAVLRDCPGLTVDVHAPSFILTVEVRGEGAFAYSGETPGPGGLPVGTQGKGLLLISGGIDSPVAGYLAIKRGVAVDALHFWSYPMTSERSKDKVVRLARVLIGYNPFLRLYVAPFTNIQTSIMESCPERYRVTVMRRMMMRVASALAERVGALAIFTGESVGQVASQTLESLAVIEDASSFPVMRPLLCFNKVETVGLARKVGTYDLSALPYEDCCSVFVPKHPVIKPRLEDVRRAEGGLDCEALAKDCVERAEEVSLD